jgi:hypothetical protein
MARCMPALEAAFRQRVADAMRIAQIGEIARAEACAGSQTRRDLRAHQIELLYEMAFLRIFVAWEAFVEQAFLRYLCGYRSRIGAAVLLPGVSYSPTLADAERAVLHGRSYVLWYNPQQVVQRSQQVFTSCPIETVVLSNSAHLTSMAAVRHHIAHLKTDTRRQFDIATMAIAGKRYRGGRPGAFLRDWDVGATPGARWLDQLGRELQGLATQIA